MGMHLYCPCLRVMLHASSFGLRPNGLVTFFRGVSRYVPLLVTNQS